jgi:hypothetical protein
MATTPKAGEMTFIAKRERSVIHVLRPRFMKWVASAKPVSTVSPAATGTGTVGQTLSCSTGTWTPSTKPFAYTYQWRRSGADILGATGSTYLLVAADSAKTVSCAVTAANNEGAATALSNTVAVT